MVSHRAHAGPLADRAGGFLRDERCVRVVWESGLHGLEVEGWESVPAGAARESGGHQRLAHRGVGAPHAERGDLEAQVARREHRGVEAPEGTPEIYQTPDRRPDSSHVAGALGGEPVPGVGQGSQPDESAGSSRCHVRIARALSLSRLARDASAASLRRSSL